MSAWCRSCAPWRCSGHAPAPPAVPLGPPLYFDRVEAFEADAALRQQLAAAQAEVVSLRAERDAWRSEVARISAERDAERADLLRDEPDGLRADRAAAEDELAEARVETLVWKRLAEKVAPQLDAARAALAAETDRCIAWAQRFKARGVELRDARAALEKLAGAVRGLFVCLADGAACHVCGEPGILIGYRQTTFGAGWACDAHAASIDEARDTRRAGAIRAALAALPASPPAPAVVEPDDEHIIRLTPKGLETLQAMLDEPADPSPELIELMRPAVVEPVARRFRFRCAECGETTRPVVCPICPGCGEMFASPMTSVAAAVESAQAFGLVTREGDETYGERPDESVAPPPCPGCVAHEARADRLKTAMGRVLPKGNGKGEA